MLVGPRATSQRAHALKQHCISTLPPCRNCLREHIKGVTYQIGIWKRSHISKPDYPAPTDGHEMDAEALGGFKNLN